MHLNRVGSTGRGGKRGAGDLRVGMIFSAVFHLLVVLFAVFGLPQLMSPPPEVAPPVIVELAQLGDKTTPPPRQVEAPKPEVKAEPAKEEPKVEPPKPPEPKPEPPKPEPKPEPPKPEPKPEPPKPVPPPPPPKVEPEPVPVPVPAPKPKPPEPPKEQPKPDPLKDIKPPPKRPPPKDDFDTLLKSVDKMRPKESAPAKPQQQAAVGSKTVNSPSSDLSSQPTVSEKDYIVAQIWPRWNVDLGAKGADTLQITVKAIVQPDGTVTSARLDVDPERYRTDSFFRAAADAALRAVLSASPLKPPPTRPDLFRNDPNYVVRFDPRSMVR
jgi:hypothetical protein